MALNTKWGGTGVGTLDNTGNNILFFTCLTAIQANLSYYTTKKCLKQNWQGPEEGSITIVWYMYDGCGGWEPDFVEQNLELVIVSHTFVNCHIYILFSMQTIFVVVFEIIGCFIYLFYFILFGGLGGVPDVFLNLVGLSYQVFSATFE